MPRSRHLLAVALLAAGGAAFAPALSLPAAAAPGASAEAQVNATTFRAQQDAAVAMDADGDYVVAWAHLSEPDFFGGFYGNIHLHRFSADGRPAGPEVVVNTTTAGDQKEPSIAMDAAGDFVVVWSTLNGTTNQGEVRAQRFAADGTRSGGEEVVHVDTAQNQVDPSVAMGPSGGYVVTWTEGDGDGTGVFLKRFSAAGSAETTRQRANTETVANQNQPSVAVDGQGGFVVTWVSAHQDGGNDGIYLQRFTPAGVAQGPELRVNTQTLDNQIDPVVATDADGRVVVAWTSAAQDGSGFGVYTQRYDEHGATVGTETRVNRRTFENQFGPTVAMDGDGDHRIAWHSFGQDGSTFGIYSQRYDAEGGAVGRETRLNLTTANEQVHPAIAMDADGDHVVAWASAGQDGSDLGVFARRFRGSGEVDLAVAQSAAAGPVATASRVTHRVRVANRTPETADLGVDVLDAAVGSATEVRAVVTPAPGSTVQSATGPGWSCGAPGATLTCRLTTVLPAATSAPDLSVVVTAPGDAGPAVQSVEVSAHQADPTPGDNADIDQTQVQCSIQLAAPSYNVDEAGTLTASVTRSGADCGTSSVAYATTGASATPGADFTSVAGNLTWADGETTKTITVPITDDGLDERNEQLTLRITDPASALLGSRTAATATITDDDDPPRIRFTTTGATLPEGGFVDLTVQLSEAAGQDVTVNLAKAGGATYLTDYLAPKRVTIPAGQRSVTFEVDVLDDALDEPNEVAFLTLGSPTGATVGTQKTYRLDITDND